jgi:hypothetical protein
MLDSCCTCFLSKLTNDSNVFSRFDPSFYTKNSSLYKNQDITCRVGDACEGEKQKINQKRKKTHRRISESSSGAGASVLNKKHKKIAQKKKLNTFFCCCISNEYVIEKKAFSSPLETVGKFFRKINSCIFKSFFFGMLFNNNRLSARMKN